MPVTVRRAQPEDAEAWLELLRATLGNDYPAPQVYDLSWISQQFHPLSGQETWFAELDGKMQASVAFLGAAADNRNPVANLGRNLHRPESYENEAGKSLLAKVRELCSERSQIVVTRLLAADNRQQLLYESMEYVCVGFQPFKHIYRIREGILFYLYLPRADLLNRLMLSDSLPQVSELATVALNHLKLSNPVAVRDGIVGYPLQSNLQFQEVAFEDYKQWRIGVGPAAMPAEVSGGYNLGLGLLRIDPRTPKSAILAQRDGQTVAGLTYHFDDQDRCMRIVNTFATDDVSTGSLIHQAARVAQQQLNAVFVELDILMTAPRLLKSADQLGFVPIAYFPGFFLKDGRHIDVVKFVKLNMMYSLENIGLTPHARAVVELIDRNFQDQKIGVAVINLLGGLPIFDGLGDGDLRKMARLFVQKLYRGGEKVFSKGDLGAEAYVVMRGQIDIYFEDNAKPVASVSAGQIFGELAFLDGTPRVATAVANQASILLVVQRSAFTDLVQREPLLGMIVMRNIAMEISNKLRRSNVAQTSSRLGSPPA